MTDVDFLNSTYYDIHGILSMAEKSLLSDHNPNDFRGMKNACALVVLLRLHH